MSELARGFCRYCGAQLLVHAEQDEDQEAINKRATEACTCSEASAEMIKRKQRDKCLDNIRTICGSIYEEAGDVLRGAIGPIQDGILAGVSVTTVDSRKISLRMSKDGIKASIEYKKKQERLA